MMYLVKHKDGSFLVDEKFPVTWGSRTSARAFNTEDEALKSLGEMFAETWIVRNVTVAHRFHVSPEEAYRMVRKVTFRPFQELDWETFAGCETESPEIAEIDEYTIILDGDSVSIIHEMDGCGGQSFKLGLIPC